VRCAPATVGRAGSAEEGGERETTGPTQAAAWRCCACGTAACWSTARWALDGALEAALACLGPVRHIVSPNYEHIAYAAQVCAPAPPHVTPARMWRGGVPLCNNSTNTRVRLPQSQTWYQSSPCESGHDALRRSSSRGTWRPRSQAPVTNPQLAGPGCHLPRARLATERPPLSPGAAPEASGRSASPPRPRTRAPASRPRSRACLAARPSWAARRRRSGRATWSRCGSPTRPTPSRASPSSTRRARSGLPCARTNSDCLCDACQPRGMPRSQRGPWPQSCFAYRGVAHLGIHPCGDRQRATCHHLIFDDLHITPHQTCISVLQSTARAGRALLPPGARAGDERPLLELPARRARRHAALEVRHGPGARRRRPPAPAAPARPPCAARPALWARAGQGRCWRDRALLPALGRQPQHPLLPRRRLGCGGPRPRRRAPAELRAARAADAGERAQVYRRFYKRFMIKDGGALPVPARAQGDMACTRALHDGLRPARAQGDMACTQAHMGSH